MNTFIGLFLAGCLVIAIAMEFIKLKGFAKARTWNLIAILLSIIIDLSIFFGVENAFHPFLLPFMIIATYILQYTLNQYGAKKILLAIIRQYLKKHSINLDNVLKG